MKRIALGWKGVQIGTDPEFFVQNEDETIISSIGFFGGTKEEKRRLYEYQGLSVEEDGVAVEFSVPPSRTSEEMKGYMKDIFQAIPSVHFSPDDLKVSRKASYSFPEEQLRHPKSRIFGCDPDYNAYTLKVNARPKCDDPNFRTCGGHVHISWTDPLPQDMNNEDKAILIRALDLFLGIPSLFDDSDTERRKLYGKAGCYRTTSYGIEYRVLSNYWTFEDTLIDKIFDGVYDALSFYTLNKEAIADPDSILCQDIQRAINETDLDLAKKLTEYVEEWQQQFKSLEHQEQEKRSQQKP